MRIGSLIGVLLATLFIVSIVALAIPIHSSVTIETVGQWETLTNAPATWSNNNGHRIEAMGNYIYFWPANGSTGFYRYNPSTSQWETLPNAPSFSSSYGVGIVRAKDTAGNPAIYIMGGSSTAMGGFYRYTDAGGWSAALNTSIPWQGSSSQAKPRNGSEFVWDGGDTIYYFPGSGYDYNQHDWYKYTISTNSWSYMGEFGSGSGDPKNGPGNSGCFVTYNGENYIYIQFGHTPSGSYESGLFMRYQISTGQWTQMAQTGYGADDGADLVWNGRDNLYLFPGAYEEGGGIDEYRFLTYSISKTQWAPLPDLPSPGGQGNGCDDGGAAGIVGDYVYKLKGNDSNGDTSSTLFYRYQMPPVTPTATATGPTGSTNNPSVSITYTYTLTPDNVNIYYTKNGGTSWTLASTDTSVDGTFAYNITSGDGTYGWIAVAIGGGSTETNPPAGGTTPEAASLILDNTAPQAPTLVSPTDGTITNVRTPTFKWNSVSDPSGVTYQIQVDNDPSFSSPEVNVAGLGVTTYTPSVLADENYSWRVRAVDGVGNPSAWSSVWTLLISSSLYWMQTGWTGGPTKPSLQVGTWNPAYDNFYDNENVDWSAGVNLKSQSGVYRNGWFESSIFDAGVGADWGTVSWGASTPSSGALDNYTYVSSYSAVKGTVTNFNNQQSASDGGAYSTLAERSVSGGLNFTEGFENGGSIPAGWTFLNNWAIKTNRVRTGSYSAGVTGNAGSTNILISKSFDFTGDSNVHLTFYDYASSAASTSTITVDASIDGGATWTVPVKATFTVSNGSWGTRNDDQDLSSLAGKSNVKFRWTLVKAGATTSYVVIDDITFTASGTTVYDMEINENINSIPSADNQTLQLRYELANTSDTFNVQVWNGSVWNTRGSSLSSTSWDNWSYTLLSNEVIGGTVQVKFIDNNPSSTAQDSILIDYLRVRSQAAPWSTSIVVELRTGGDNNPYDGGWSNWYTHDNNTENTLMPDNRYVQYRVELSTTNQNYTPALLSGSVVINYEVIAVIATGPTGITNNPNVTLTYTCMGSPDNVNIYYTKDTSPPYTWTLAVTDMTVDGSEPYIITSGDGTYGWIAVAIGGGSTETDPPAGGTTPEAASLILDTTPPTSSVDAISSYWKTSTSFTVTASASDALSGLNRVALWYRYSSDNLSWGAWTWFDNDTASPWSWTFTSPSGNGYYQLYSTARDNAGNEEAAPGTADAICGVDTTLPTSSVNTISSYWQISTSFTVTASANDALSGLAKVALWYRYSSDNSSWDSWTWFDNDSTSPWSWTFTSPSGNGYYQLYSTARDNAGNEEAAPGVADAICGVDNTLPTSSVNAISPYWQTSTSFTVNATASDALSGVNRVALWYRYSSDNSSWGAWTWFDNDTASPWSWTFTSPSGNGYYQLYSTARDNAGNEEAAPVAADTICGVDNASPNAPLILEPENGMIIGDNTPTFRWTAVTDLSSPVTYTLQVDNDSNFSSPEVNVSGLIDNAYTPIAELADGTYYWHVRAVDNAGNVGDNSAYCSFRIDVTPPGKPTLVSPDNNSTTTDNTPTFKWTAITDPSGLTYTLVVDNEAGFTSPYIYYKISISENQHTCENELAAGTYYWRVRAVDNVGNEGEWADNFKLTILNLPTLPGKPTLVSPANNVTTSDNTPTFVWTRGSNADNHRIEVDNDSNFSSPIDNVVVASPNDNTWTKPSPGYTNGTYYWRVWAKNAYGENVSETTWQFTVESPTWINTGDLENARHVYSLLYASDGAVYAGTASGDDPWDSVGVVFKTTDGGTTWVPTASLGGLGVVGNIEAMIQTSGGTIDNNILIGTAWEGKIFKTTNGGNNWIQVVDLPGVVEVDSLIQAANGDLYAGTHYGGGPDEARIYRSTNYGDSWQVVAASSIDGELSGCTTVECLIQASTGYFYCGTQPGHVWRSDNGDNWYKVGDKDINFGGSYKMYSLLDASNGYIYAASRNPGNVYRSTDNGNTWAEVANGVTELGGATRTDGLCQASNGMIYVGTDVGEIYRTADGDIWVLEANLPADRVNAIIEANLGWMYAGTSYNGDVFTTYISPAIPWTGMATFRLENLYKVSLEKDLQLNTGSKLVVKFYKYDNVTLQANSVIEDITPPQSVAENENVPHPRAAEGFSWGTVQIARLVLTTDNENEVISTIASFTVHQSDLRNRYMVILRAWGGHPEQQDAFRAEVMDILRQWSSAPP